MITPRGMEMNRRITAWALTFIIAMLFFGMVAFGQVFTQNFFGSGNPNGVILAKAGVEYIDIQARIKYRQTTISQGTNWIVVAVNVTVSTDFMVQGTVNIYGSGITVAGENYLTKAGALLTAHPVNLGTTHVTGILPITKGGTGGATATQALTNLLPVQGGNAGKFLTTNGTVTSWAATGGGGGTVTNVGTGYGLSGGPITITGTIITDTSCGTCPASKTYVTNSISAITGYVPTSRILTINGTAQDLSADRSWSVGTVTSVGTGYGLSGGTFTTAGTVIADTSCGTCPASKTYVNNAITGFTPALTSKSIGYGSGANLLTGSANLTWDDLARDLNVTGTISQILTNTNNVYYVAQGNAGFWFTGTASTGLLNHQGFGMDFKTTEKYTMGDVGIGNNNYIEINNTANTLKASTLAGTGTQMVTADINGFLAKQAIPAGSVTSVGLSLPGEFTVTGSPVTTSGTLTGAWASATRDQVFASPVGVNGIPSFRALASTDIPALAYVTSVGSGYGLSGGPITGTGTLVADTTSGTGLVSKTRLSNSIAGFGSGTVTSVGQTFTGGLISVAGSPITTSGTLALTVAGTSGGIPYFSSATAWASSAALAANAIVIGGGAGTAPSTTTTGTGVLTALGVNVGTVGAFVTNGGALGTPSSGTGTNLTGIPLTTGLIGGNWKTIYTNGSGVVTELALGSSGKVLTTNGASSAPTWETPATASMAIGGTITSATAGSVLFAGTSGLLQQINSKFFFDSTNTRLGIGTATPAASIDITETALGAASVPTTKGLQVTNTTVAAAGAQQLSPMVRWSGQGWKTNATAASQEVAFTSLVLPVQGTANPTGEWRLYSQINGATATNQFSVSSAGLGTLTAGLTLGGLLTLNTGSTGVAPVKFTSGPLKSSKVNGNLQYQDTTLYISSATFDYKIAKYLSATATLDFASTLAGTSTDLTITVTGAAATDYPVLTVPNGSMPATGVFSCWMSAANTCSIRFANNSLTLSLDPASGTFGVIVIKP